MLVRRLTIFVAVLAALYSGYWFVGARAVKTAAEDALQQVNASGWTVDYSEINTRGFPSRFDTTVEAIRVLSPQGAVQYAAEFAQVLALSYAPNRVIAVLADLHELWILGVPFRIATDDLRASVAVSASTDLAFETATAEVGPVTIEAPTGDTFRAASALLASRLSGESSYDLYAEIVGIRLPDTLLELVDPADQLPATIPRMAVDSTLQLDRAIDRHVVLGAPPPLAQRLDVKEISFAWGPMQLRGAGVLDVDVQGVPSGRLTFTIDAWEDMLDALVAVGAIEDGVAPTWRQLGQTISGGEASLTLPIDFRGGLMSIGIWPLGVAPRFR